MPELPAEKADSEEPKLNHEDEVSAEEADALERDDEDEDEIVRRKLGCLDSFCAVKFYGFIKSSVKYVFPLLLIIWAIAFGIAASNLQPTSETDQALKSDHPFQRFLDSSNNDFGISTNSQMKPVRLVFGLEDPPIDRSELVNKYSRKPGAVLNESVFSCLSAKHIIVRNTPYDQY